jgi:hypothetical protein
MARPIYRWRQDELDDKATLDRDPRSGAELKVQAATYRIWLEADGVTVREEERQDDQSWKLVDTYPARPRPRKPSL